MRTLTAKQKKLLDTFFNSMIEKDEEKKIFNDAPFKHGHYSVSIEDMFKYDDELMGKLEQINDTEILHQEVNRYLGDKSSEYNHKH
jgi:hypothetical protein